MVVKVRDAGVQPQKFLSAFPPLEPLLTSLLSSCGVMFLLNNVVVAGRRDHLRVMDVSQARDLPDGCSVTSELVGVNDLWNVVFTQKSGQEGLRSSSVSVQLEQNVEHEAVFVGRPPQPMPDTIHRRADLVQVPSGTPPGFPVTQFVGEQRTKCDAPLPECLMTDLDAALVEQFLNISVAEWKAVAQPDGVLDDGHLGIGGGKAWRRSQTVSLPRSD